MPRALAILFAVFAPLLFAAQSLVWPDVDGKAHQPLAPTGAKAAVLLFLACDCPISNVYAPEIARLRKEFAALPLYLVYPDPEVTAASARKHATEYKLPGVLLVDPKIELARGTAATIAPEAVVVDAVGKVVYRGPINNRFEDLGRERNVTTEHDLRDALWALLAGKSIAVAQTKAIGCFIPELKKK